MPPKIPFPRGRNGHRRSVRPRYREERRKKPQPLTTGASWQSGSKLEFGPSRSASRRAEHFLVALLPSKRLLLSAKHLLFEVNRSDRPKPNSGVAPARTGGQDLAIAP